jgi:peptide/nickel transport system substrate-binding protein
MKSMKIIKHLRMMHRQIIGITLAFITTFFLGGCNPTNFLKSEAAQVPYIVYASLSEPNSFNYIISQGSPDVLSLLYEGLLSQNGLTGELEPALAEKWEISPDKKQIVFTLREGLKWSDGQPLTADDVVFTYNQIFFNEEIPTDIRDILRIGKQGLLPKVRKIDPRRVEFTVPEPFAPFLRYTGGLAILPAHALQKSIETKDSQGKPLFLTTWDTNTDPKEIIGNGPYIIESYLPSQQVVLRRNPYYWQKDEQGNPLPYIERFVWTIVESTDTQLLQFRSGSLDLFGVTPDYFSLLKQEEERGKFTIYTDGPELSTTFLVFNLNQARNTQNKPFVDPIKSRWFNNQAFRKAVAYAIDRQKMINNIYQGLGEAQNSPIYRQSQYYLSPEEGLPVYDYNPEKAKQLLKEAGFKYNARGELLDEQGNRVRFDMLTNAGNKLREAIGSQLKQDLAGIGIQVDFRAIAFNTLLDKVYTQRQWDSYIGKIGGGGVEPNGGANLWLTKGGLHAFNLGPQEGEPSIRGWQVADWEQEIENLYIQGAGELDEVKRKAIYAQTQKITQEQLPFIYLVNPLTMTAVRNRIQGIQYSSIGGALWNLPQLKIVESED